LRRHISAKILEKKKSDVVWSVDKYLSSNWFLDRLIPFRTETNGCVWWDISRDVGLY